MPRHRPTARPLKNHSEDRQTSPSPSPSKHSHKVSPSSVNKKGASFGNGESKRKSNGVVKNHKQKTPVPRHDDNDTEMTERVVVKNEKSKAPIKNGKHSHPSTSIKSPRNTSQANKGSSNTSTATKTPVKQQREKKELSRSIKPEPGTARFNRKISRTAGTKLGDIGKLKDKRELGSGGIKKPISKPKRKTNLFPKFVITGILTDQAQGPHFNKSAESLTIYQKYLELKLEEVIRQALICTVACGRITVSSEDVACAIQATF